MPFNPDIPVADSEITSAELRANFNNLNDRCLELESAMEGHALKPSGVAPVESPTSDPPTQGDVETLREKINELLAALND